MSPAFTSQFAGVHRHRASSKAHNDQAMFTQGGQQYGVLGDAMLALHPISDVHNRKTGFKPCARINKPARRIAVCKQANPFSTSARRCPTISSGKACE